MGGGRGTCDVGGTCDVAQTLLLTGSACVYSSAPVTVLSTMKNREYLFVLRKHRKLE